MTEEDGIRFATLESRFEKKGNSLKFVNHKSVLLSMQEMMKGSKYLT